MSCKNDMGVMAKISTFAKVWTLPLRKLQKKLSVSLGCCAQGQCIFGAGTGDVGELSMKETKSNVSPL